MSNDPIYVWLSWTSWLFGFRFSRSEIGICFGPLQVSIMPAHFTAPSDKGRQE